MKRKSITKKIRFEVFKRDSFKCQYCGKEAPDVVLEIDHIMPVKEGGTSDLINLITSCYDCNRGKSSRKLNDNSELKKQKLELDKLNKRKEQLKMLVVWRNEIININEDEIDVIDNIIQDGMDCHLSGHGRKNMKNLIKNYGLKEVMESTDISINQYYTGEDSIEKVVKYIHKICISRKLQKDKPYLKDLYYLRGILKNRIYVSTNGNYMCMQYYTKAYEKTKDINLLKDITLSVRSWTQFKEAMEEIING